MNKNLFRSALNTSKMAPAVDTVNEAGGKAYSLSDKAALAQLVCTGVYNSAFYSSAEEQLKLTLELAQKVSPKFLAQLAVYARQNALMKDSPALLAAILSSKDVGLLSKVFARVINNPKMFRNFIKVVRSGVTGRKNFGSRPKKLLQNFLASLTDEQLFAADVGNDPSLQDCIKMIRPKAETKERAAMLSYLLDRDFSRKDLCAKALAYEEFKSSLDEDMPNVPFLKLTSLPLTDGHWKTIARNATWDQTRQNLNSFAKHGVFSDTSLTNLICQKLSDEKLVKSSKTFPYQLFAAYHHLDASVPNKVKLALQEAFEYSLDNIPEFNDDGVYLMVDTSGSMSSPVTGNRGSVTSKVRCIDVASLFACSILRKNKNAEIIPFDTKVHTHNLNPMDSVMTNATALSRFGGGGTNCASALASLNARKAKGSLVIYLSDNESYMDDQHRNSTATMKEWVEFKKRNKNAKLVNIDIQPYTSTQTKSNKDVLNIGGFSDQIFSVVSSFVNQDSSSEEYWVDQIEKVSL